MSTDEQSSSGTGLQAQRRAIIAECERRGWHLFEVIEDAGFSAKNMKRPGVQEALRSLEAGQASALVVAKLDRLSRSMIDFTALMGTAQTQHWALVRQQQVLVAIARKKVLSHHTPPGRREDAQPIVLTPPDNNPAHHGVCATASNAGLSSSQGRTLGRLVCTKCARSSWNLVTAGNALRRDTCETQFDDRIGARMGAAQAARILTATIASSATNHVKTSNKMAVGFASSA